MKFNTLSAYLAGIFLLISGFSWTMEREYPWGRSQSRTESQKEASQPKPSSFETEKLNLSRTKEEEEKYHPQLLGPLSPAHGAAFSKKAPILELNAQGKRVEITLNNWENDTDETYIVDQISPWDDSSPASNIKQIGLLTNQGLINHGESEIIPFQERDNQSYIALKAYSERLPDKALILKGTYNPKSNLLTTTLLYLRERNRQNTLKTQATHLTNNVNIKLRVAKKLTQSQIEIATPSKEPKKPIEKPSALRTLPGEEYFFEEWVKPTSANAYLKWKAKRK